MSWCLATCHLPWNNQLDWVSGGSNCIATRPWTDRWPLSMPPSDRWRQIPVWWRQSGHLRTALASHGGRHLSSLADTHCQPDSCAPHSGHQTKSVCATFSRLKMPLPPGLAVHETADWQIAVDCSPNTGGFAPPVVNEWINKYLFAYIIFILYKNIYITKASEASWSYSCDSKVSFDRVQILTPDFSGRRPPPLPPSPPLRSSPLSPPHLPSPPPCLPPTFPPSLPPPSSQVRLRPVVALWHLWHAVSVAYLAAALSHCLTVSLSLSLSFISLISFSSLSSLSLSPLSLSPLCLSSFRLSSLSSLAGRSRQRATYKGLFIPASKRAPCFFLPRCPPLSHSGALAFAPPLASSIYIFSYVFISYL